MNSVVDVLIIGAGPTGLTLAIECARYHLSCKIIDQSPVPTTYSKATAIQARTLECFQRMGIHERFLAAGIQLKRSNIHSGDKKTYLNLQQIQSPFPFVLSIEQSKTEQILNDALKELGCSVERPVRLISYEEKEGFIFAHTDKGVVQTKYLIGCDGAHSTVRKAMGCTFKGKMFSDVFSLADIKIAWDRPHNEVQIFLEADGILAAFPLPEKDRFRLVFQLKRLRGLLRPSQSIEHGILQSKEITEPTLPEIQQLLSNYAQEPVLVSDPRWIANFHINSRLSNGYRHNNVFLAGDAAHIHSPVGGQGMNTGIQDAFNLAWKIAYVHQQISSPTLLNSYEEERHSLGKKLLKATETASTIATLRSPILLSLRNSLLFTLLSFDCIQRKIAAAISEVDLSCPHKRVRNFTVFHDGKEGEYFTLSEKSKQFHLLLFNCAKPPLDHPCIATYHVKESSDPKALLVRPDGYLALEDRPPFKKLMSYQF